MKSDEVRDAEVYVKNLILSGENVKLDFKYEISDARKIARTFSAFANTSGGKLLIGVKDNGKISGVKSEEEAYMAESAAHIFCKPLVNFQLHKWKVDGKTILEVNIPPSNQRPHFAKNETGKWVAFIRINDQNIQANRVLVNVWKGKSSKGICLSYGKEEEILMNYLNLNKTISLSKFTRIARINKYHAEQLLVKLILMKVIDFEVSERSCVYILHEREPVTKEST